MFFKSALAKGASLKRHENTPVSAYKILQTIINNHSLLLQIQRELSTSWPEERYITDLCQ